MAVIVPRAALEIVVLIPPHRPLSEVIAMATFLSTSAAAAYLSSETKKMNATSRAGRNSLAYQAGHPIGSKGVQ